MKKTTVTGWFVFLTAGCLAITAVYAQEAAGREYYVAVNGDDGNDGSAAAPFKTISAAAAIAQPGDTVTVHEGIYREWINPPRGGESDAKRIVYQAAPGEQVVVTGAEVVTGRKRWSMIRGRLCCTTRSSAVQPYADLIHGDWFTPGPPAPYGRCISTASG